MPTASSEPDPALRPCPLRTKPCVLETTRGIVLVNQCSAICAELGWAHAVPEATCLRCQDDPSHPNSVEAAEAQKVIRIQLFRRVAHLHSWDINPAKVGTFRDNLDVAVGRCKAVSGDDAAAAALVQAVRTGLNATTAETLARKHMPEKL